MGSVSDALFLVRIVILMIFSAAHPVQMDFNWLDLSVSHAQINAKYATETAANNASLDFPLIQLENVCLTVLCLVLHAQITNHQFVLLASVLRY